MARAEPPPADASPVFLLSFHHRDALATVADRAGWTAIAARRSAGAERRFVASGAAVAVVDLRGAYDAGLAAVRALGAVAEANGAALLVLLAREDVIGLEALLTAGATHYLASPFGELELRMAILFAARHVERLAGGAGAARRRADLVEAEAESWRWHPGAGDITIAPPLARRIGLQAGPVPLAAAARWLGPGDLRPARAAIARLIDDGRPTAFAHDMAGSRIAHHLHLGEGGVVIARVEEMIDAPARDRRSRDPLTGLIDAAGLRVWIDTLVAPGRPGCTLILIGLGRYEVVNAAYGTSAGDALLRGVARRIERQVAETVPEECGKDICIARIAGTRFAVALGPEMRADCATTLADEIAGAITRPFALGERLARLSCRIGIADTGAEDDAEAMLRRADAALEEAKAAEPGSIRMLDATGEAAVAYRTRLEADLREALARDEIEMLYQPQISVATGRVVGVEALARWRHPEFGSLGAVTLFSVAERSDFLLPLSRHVQQKALDLAVQWGPELAGLRLAVNVTASDVAQADFAERFLAMVDASGFARDRLTVELTESGLIEDLAEAAGLLATLRAAGLRVAVDDFGTGYSSLAYLKALPLDYLKIDKRLADDIVGSPRDRVVVRGVIEMARSLGLAVVAEGVETEEQLGLLAAEGCNYYQGFLCSPPVDAVELTRIVAQAGCRAAPPRVNAG